MRCVFVVVGLSRRAGRHVRRAERDRGIDEGPRETIRAERQDARRGTNQFRNLSARFSRLRSRVSSGAELRVTGRAYHPAGLRHCRHCGPVRDVLVGAASRLPGACVASGVGATDWRRVPVHGVRGLPPPAPRRRHVRWQRLRFPAAGRCIASTCGGVARGAFGVMAGGCGPRAAKGRRPRNFPGGWAVTRTLDSQPEPSSARAAIEGRVLGLSSLHGLHPITQCRWNRACE